MRLVEWTSPANLISLNGHRFEADEIKYLPHGDYSDRSDLKSTLTTIEPQPQNREEEPVIAELSVATENSQLLAELHDNVLLVPRTLLKIPAPTWN